MFSSCFMSTILLDVDGVIADFRKLYIEIASEIIGAQQCVINPYEWESGDALGLTEDEKKRVDAVLYDQGTALKIEPYPDAIESVLELDRSGHDVYFVTKPLDGADTWASDRILWLRKYFGNKLGNKYVLTGCKHLVRGDIFVDDKVENVQPWKEIWKHSLPILWAHEYNSTTPGIIRTNKWNRVIELAKYFKARINEDLTSSNSNVRLDG